MDRVSKFQSNREELQCQVGGVLGEAKGVFYLFLLVIILMGVLSPLFYEGPSRACIRDLEGARFASRATNMREVYYVSSGRRTLL